MACSGSHSKFGAEQGKTQSHRLPPITRVTTSFPTWWLHRTPQLATEGQILAIGRQRMSGVPREGAAGSQKQTVRLLAREKVRMPTAVTAAPLGLSLWAQTRLRGRASSPPWPHQPRDSFQSHKHFTPEPEWSGRVVKGLQPWTRGEGLNARVIPTPKPCSEGEEVWGFEGSQSSPAFLLS